MILINLFSVFDPVSYFNLHLGWIVIFFMFTWVIFGYYVIRFGFNLFLRSFSTILGRILKDIAKPNEIGIVYLCVAVFLYLSISNLIGLIPFIFTSTAYPLITLGLGLVIWLSFFLIGWFKNFNVSCAHLVPEGRPLVLAPLLVLIERVRHLIRPFTLSIRLAANMIAGHLIVGLLSRVRIIRIYGIFSSLCFQSVLIILELCVCIIQGFVFRILLILYALEYY